MDGERIRELAEQAAKETAIEFTDRARAQPDAIERAIRAALVESWGEEPTPQMIEEGCDARWPTNSIQVNTRQTWEAMAKFKRREFEGQG